MKKASPGGHPAPVKKQAGGCASGLLVFMFALVLFGMGIWVGACGRSGAHYNNRCLLISSSPVLCWRQPA